MPLFLRLAMSKPTLGLQLMIRPLLGSSFRGSSFRSTANGMSAMRGEIRAVSSGNSPVAGTATRSTARRAAQLDRLEL